MSRAEATNAATTFGEEPLSQKEFIAGLDIGTTKTCCVLADVDLDTGAVDIIGVGLTPSDGLRKGVVVDLDATTQAIRSAVAMC